MSQQNFKHNIFFYFCLLSQQLKLDKTQDNFKYYQDFLINKVICILYNFYLGLLSGTSTALLLMVLTEL